MSRAHKSSIFPRTVRGLLLGLGGAAVYLACSSDRAPLNTNSSGGVVVDPCATAQPGCSCDQPAKVADCGTVKIVSGDYVTCSMGTMKCDGARWGTCEGDHIAFKSLGPAGGQLQTKGIGMPTPCTGNPCSPDCVVIPDDSTGTDAGGIGATDAGGWSILQGDAPSDARPVCVGLQCAVATCANAGGTQITGVVYDPAGLNPLWNAIVMVPNDLATVTNVATGPSTDPTGCGGVNLPPAVSFVKTGVNGEFTLTNVPVGASVPVLVQVGKWRRQFNVTTTACNTTVIAPSLTATSTAAERTAYPARLPRSTTEGALPRFGLVQSGCDQMECFLRRIGIADDEFTNADNATLGRVELYRGGGYGRTGQNPLPSRTRMAGGADAVVSPSRLNRYDMVILPCDCGNEYNKNGVDNLATRANLVTYANAGGRIFASHWGEEWVARVGEVSPPFPNTATFNGVGVGTPITAYIDTTFPTGNVFTQWMQGVGAGTAANTFQLTSLGSTVQSRSTLGASQRYVYGYTSDAVPRANPDLAFNYTFETPLAPGPKFGRVMFTDMHLSTGPNGSVDYGGTDFPEVCKDVGTQLSEQEKAAEFLLFDLGGCANPVPPPPVPPYFPAGSLTRDYEAVCPAGKFPKWRFLSWQTLMPSVDAGPGASITFSAQVGPTLATLAPTPPVTLANVSVTTTPPGVWFGVDLSNAATYPALQPSRSNLRLTINFTPTTNNQGTPTLLGLQQTYDCADSE
jgi:hypothetical protein